MKTRIALAMASVALLSLPAMAQTPQKHTPAAQATAAASQLYQMKPGQWRGTKLTGLNVYNNNNEKIGDVKEIILDRTGKIDAIVIGAGGFLGMGVHDVAVPFQQVKWLDDARDHQPVSGSSNPPRSERSAYRGYPDHAVVNMTKDQLKALPEVRYEQ